MDIPEVPVAERKINLSVAIYYTSKLANTRLVEKAYKGTEWKFLEQHFKIAAYYLQRILRSRYPVRLPRPKPKHRPFQTDGL